MTQDDDPDDFEKRPFATNSVAAYFWDNYIEYMGEIAL